jgi:N-acyl-phosphatidylethanolamine-hydrolysing phospholipase D
MLRNCIAALILASAASGAQAADTADASWFDGAPRLENARYRNIGGEIGHGTLGVRFPFMLRRLGTYFRSGAGAPTLLDNDGAFLRENARHSIPTVTWVGHATLLVQLEHLTFLTDPTWSNRPSPVPLIGPGRYVPPGLEMEDLPPIDFVVISHNHYDHLDLPTLRALARRNQETRFFVPMGNAELLRRNGIQQVEELDWGDTATYEGVSIHCLPSQHWSKRGLGDDNKALWSSWAVTGSQRRFYFSGDTGYFPGFKAIGDRLGPFDLVAVPIGAYAPRAMMRESHMNPEEALNAAVDLQARRAVAMHFGTFDLSDEPLDEPPRRFRQAAENSSLGASGAWVLDIGETREF